jgi:hypothetical protein
MKKNEETVRREGGQKLHLESTVPKFCYCTGTVALMMLGSSRAYVSIFCDLFHACKLTLKAQVSRNITTVPKAELGKLKVFQTTSLIT